MQKKMKKRKKKRMKMKKVSDEMCITKTKIQQNKNWKHECIGKSRRCVSKVDNE